MGNKAYCYPLTVEDNFSRYLLMCRALGGTNYEDARKWLQWAFEEYGLSTSVRSDNGTPFAAPGLTGLSQLSIWFIQLGIKLERIDKGHPEQNGRLERFHRTLKEFVIAHPQVDFASQQQLFTSFRYQYNHARPHEALGFKTPSEVYQRSRRPYPALIQNPEYGPEFQVRKVRNRGEISLDWQSFYICQLLSGEYVGIRITNNNKLEVYYYDQLIASISMSKGRVDGKDRRLANMECLERQRKYQPWKKRKLERQL